MTMELTELIGKVVIKIVREWNESCNIIRGRARMPHDQGSVERVNGYVQDVLSSI